jgi:hypothetical protein
MDTFLNLWFFASWAQILTAKASARLKRTTRNIRDLLLKSNKRSSAFRSKDYGGRFRHCKGENLQNLQRATAGEFAGSTELIAAAGSLLLGLRAHILVSEFTLLRFLWLALTGFVPVA